MAALPRYWERFNAWALEFAVLNISRHYENSRRFGENCGYSTFKCRGVDHYAKECPRPLYWKKLIDYVQHKDLPLNPVSTAGPHNPVSAHLEWVNRTCPALSRLPYEDQPDVWNSEHNFPIRRSRMSAYDKHKAE